MTQYANQLQTTPRLSRALILLAGVLAFAPIVFMSREIVTGNFANLDTSNADVLGSGSFTLFLAMLTITPLITVTGYRAIGPLRWWFGVMFFCTAATDLVIASIVTGSDFKGGVAGRVAGHTFLVVGTAAVCLSVIVVATANRRSQRRLGRHWKTVQRATYAVWVLVLIHLALLFSVTGARFLQAAAASLPLMILRIPRVRRWWLAERQRAGWRSRGLWLAGIALAALWLWGISHLVGEEVKRGVDALSDHPQDT